MARLERTLWGAALLLVAVLGTAGAIVTYAQPAVVAALYLPPGADPALVRTFILPDLAGYVVFPGLAAFGWWRARAWTPIMLLVAMGASLYAFLWLCGAGLVFGLGTGAALSGLAPFVVVAAALGRWRAVGAAEEDGRR